MKQHKRLQKISAVLLSLALLLSLLPQITIPASAEAPVPEDGVLTVGGTRADICYLLWWMAGSPEPTSTANPYTDISEEDYYFKAVLWTVENSITSGATKTTFAPGKDCTRGQIVTYLWRFKNSPEPTTSENPFGDVSAGAYYSKPVYWATGCSWIDLDLGDEPNVFRPDEVAVHLVGSGGSSPTFAFRDHDYVYHEAKAPTCTEAGWDSYNTCSRCDYSSYRRELPARGHNYENGVCTVCGEPAPNAETNKCGENLFWSFDEDTGVLIITGSGAMEDYSWEPNAPWYDYSADITEVKLPEGLTSIGDYAFYDCSSLASVTIPDSVTSIGEGAFWNCYSLTSVTIPDSVTSIGGEAFLSCISLTSVTIPDSVTSIGESAFLGCASLESVAIPDSVTSIGDYAFSHCSKLTMIRVSDGNPAYMSEDGVLFNKDKSELIQCPGGKSGSYQIPDSVTSIGDGAFEGCSSLASVAIPDSVTSIDPYAFHDCSKLTMIRVSDGNPAYTSEDGVLFNKDKSELIQCPGGKSGSYQIPGSVTSIGESAFSNCSSLTSVTIPDSVTSIDDYAFYGCSSLTSVTIPDGVTSIGDYAFDGCSSLTSVTIPDSVTSIGDSAFLSCISLTSVTIPDSVTSIGRHAFSWCESLTSVTIPDSVTSIGYMAFSYCSSLASVTIPDSVTSIGDMAFSVCDKLADVYYGGDEAAWGRISIYYGNDPLMNATIHYHSTGPTLPTFSDVAPNAYYAEAVSWAVANEITNGTGDGKFSPSVTCTRGQVVTFLWRAKGSPEPKNKTHPFTDVNEKGYYYNAMLWAVENGITTGADKTHFAPGKTCTRGQVVTFLWRAKGSPEPKNKTHPFTDVNEKGYYYNAMLWAVENGITTGATKTTFAPDKSCTRGQVVAFLFRDLG